MYYYDNIYICTKITSTTCPQYVQYLSLVTKHSCIKTFKDSIQHLAFKSNCYNLHCHPFPLYGSLESNQESVYKVKE